MSGSNKETGDFLRKFTEREENLKARLRVIDPDFELPPALRDWKLWIGDPLVYIDRLASFVEDQEARKHR